MEQESLLTDLETRLVYAGAGQRFANYIIDLIVYDLLVRFIIDPMVASGNNIIYAQIQSPAFLLFLNQVFFFVVYTSYMFLLETIFKGKSIGKFVTGTKAVNEDGTIISAKTALLRSLSRIIPFEPFSALGNPSRPWHDRWTHTFVINEKKSILNPEPGV